MFLIDEIHRNALSRCRVMREADKGASGSASSDPIGSAPAAALAEGIAGKTAAFDPADLDFPGGGMLLGVENDGGPDEFVPAADFTDPNADEPEAEIAVPPATEQAAEETAETGPETPEVKAEKEKAAWPESAQKRVDTLTAQKSELARERDELRGKLESIESRPQLPPAAPSAESPLVGVHDETALAAHAELAELAEEWADENREGGELPAALQAAIYGSEDLKTTGARDLTAAEALQLLKNARRMQRKHIPARREYLAQAKATDGWMKEAAPEMLDTSTPEAQLFAGFEKLLPQLKANPAWKQALALMVRGHLATQGLLAAKAAKAAAPKKEDKTPVAPLPPAAAIQRGTRPAIAKPDRAPKLRANMTRDEMFAAGLV